ncbi:type II secretion system protein [Roseimicrobium sp. ORNL1]|uniref:PulJ/GspJ family protein n=1 Tax=Roseimicrobium sp. ORNL1 TaxID=2711231 RepID=UPI0013E12813|nr:type II secretion system protein [Roseimicrobium sp. ORNL1]QIF00278.1 prepilin-type N-terminal cleavage/methylation domain-containing protein [Roseimicrobium sp. ORNL1]
MQPWRTTSKTSPSGICSGFTLVELLVSTAVLGLLLVFLAQVSNVVAKTWTDSQGRAERRQNGRALVDFIARDLRGAALPVNSGTPRTVPNLQFVLNPPTVEPQDRNPSALFWQAPVGTATAMGDMAVLGYLVRWDGSGPYPRAALCRVFLNPGDPNHRIYLPGHVDSWIDSAVLDAAAPGTRVSGYRGLFAENVIGFWAKCLDVKGNVVTNVTGGGFSSRQDYTGRDGSSAVVTYKAPVLPTSVEVSIVLLDSRSASRITPPMQDALMRVVRDSDDADSCVKSLQSSASFKPIIQGATAHTLRVYLENGP